MHKKIIEFVHGWRTWSTQAVELRLFHADQENQHKEGHVFYKMYEASITMIRDDLSEDFFELMTSHMAEITKLLEE